MCQNNNHHSTNNNSIKNARKLDNPRYTMKLLSNTYTHLLVILVGTSLLEFSLGWSSGVGRPNQCPGKFGMPTKTTAVVLSASTDDVQSSASISSNTVTTSRRDVVRRTLTTLIGGTVASTALLSSSATLSTTTGRFGFVQSAHADVTNKVASSTALRTLTRAQNQLPTKLLPDVQANNFIGVKARIREPPFDNMRKSAQTLVIGGEDGPKAKALVKSYKALIATLEKLDGTASLGMRGRNIGDLEMTQQYEDIVLALDAFLKVGAEAAEIPVQEQPSMQENLRTGSIETKVLKGE